MKIYYKEWTQHLPISLDEAWAFFSRPENLNELTPKDMSFEILTDIKGKPMYQGMLIRYKIVPMLNIKMNWCTEITHIRDRQYFIDEQRFGPYALWHHEHHFQAVDGGTLMRDELHYAIPYGPIGQLANAIFVGNKVEEIFEFRNQAIEQLFGMPKAVTA
ncbi:MAG: SRPBCC family protein [Bacteroidota bacterium]|mgnify:CR=1 FL=1